MSDAAPPADRTYAQQPGELVLLPAVDIQSGTAVRLVEGRAGTETEYGDPVAAARQWVEQGAAWLHVVDLDAAFRRGSNLDVLAKVVHGVDVPVEVSGGIRDDASLAAALGTGAARVVIGTAALEDPDWVGSVIAEHGDRIAVSLDVRGHTLAARGWTSEGGDLWEAVERLDRQGCARYVVTDVTKDGTLKGPNTHLLKDVLRATRTPVIASGGIAHVNDLHHLQAMVPHGLEGAIIGKALYEGEFTLAEAIAAVEPTRYLYEWNPPSQ